MREKATSLKDAYQTSWTKWLHHQGISDQVLRLLHNKFKKTVTTINNQMRKASAWIAKQ